MIVHVTVATLDHDFDDITDSLIAARPEDQLTDNQFDSELNEEYLDAELPGSLFEAVTVELHNLSSSLMILQLIALKREHAYLLSNDKFLRHFLCCQ